jgi:hypothetical protein
VGRAVIASEGVEAEAGIKMWCPIAGVVLGVMYAFH